MNIDKWTVGSQEADFHYIKRLFIMIGPKKHLHGRTVQGHDVHPKAMSFVVLPVVDPEDAQGAIQR